MCKYKRNTASVKISREKKYLVKVERLLYEANSDEFQNYAI